MVIHATLAALVSCPELAIAPDEATALCTAANRVLRHYDVALISAKALDWIGLGSVVAQVYVPRFFLIRHRQTTPGRPSTAPTPFNGLHEQPFAS